MAKQVNHIRVFVASPGDVQAERDQLKAVVNDLNRILGEPLNVVLELVTWQTHARPAAGADVQGTIFEQIGEYDIFIGIMWKRFGTPTQHAGSGTEEEFEHAYRAWAQRPAETARPVMFYFCQG